jgi:hypothetical protein
MSALIDRDIFSRETEGIYRLGEMRKSKKKPGIGQTSEDDPERVRFIEELLAKRERKESGR